PILLLRFFGYFVLMIIVFILGYRKILSFLNANPSVAVYFISLLMFAVPNLASGGFYTEYFVPLLFSLFPFIGVFFAQTYSTTKFTNLLKLTVCATCLLGLLLTDRSFIDTSGGQLPIEEVKTISSIVKSSANTDAIFALEGLWIAVETNVNTLPSMSMAQFSFLDSNIESATRLKLVNGEMVNLYFKNAAASHVVLTDLDWMLLSKTDEFESIKSALEENYTLKVERDQFGQRRGTIQVYQKRSFE
ncbi:MAG: hypothetical protein AAF902_15040, partial [Chloroflexota bacterium]